ncbi:MAG TPA: hypothetical protein VET24_04020 [Actinomycetota bacterium]|nr:hypothetical protein [Actinomycetota bacterium]
MAMEMAETPGGGLGFEMKDVQRLHAANLGRETYATFLLLAIAGFTLAGYVGLALLFVGALR